MNQTEKEYRQSPLVNASSLKMFTGQHDFEIAKHVVINGKPKTSSMSLGSVVHDLLENGLVLSFKFVISEFDSFRTKAAQQWKREREESGQEVITQAIFDQAYEMAENVIKKSPDWVFDRSVTEYEKPIYTDKFKALFDAINGKRGVDFKTTNATSPEQFQKECYKFGYYLQGSFYSHVGELDEFWFIAVSSHKPYPVWVFKMTDEALAYGEQEWKKALENMEKKHSNEMMLLDPPHWFEFTQDQTAEEAFEL